MFKRSVLREYDYGLNQVMMDCLEMYIPLLAIGQLVMDTMKSREIFIIETASLVFAVVNYFLPSGKINEYLFPLKDPIEVGKYTTFQTNMVRNYITTNPMINNIELNQRRESL